MKHTKKHDKMNWKWLCWTWISLIWNPN